MKPRKSAPLQGLVLILFLAYIAVLLKAILFKVPFELIEPAFSMEAIRTRLEFYSNLVPFKTIQFYMDAPQEWDSLANLAGNLALFGPLGLLLPVLLPKVDSFWRIGVTSLLFSLLLEVTQLVGGLGSFDVDDLLLNLVGGLLGWLVYRAGSALLGRAGRRRRRRTVA